MKCEKCARVTKHKRKTPTKFCSKCLKASVVFTCAQVKDSYYVYELYNTADQLTYIGMSTNPYWRFMDHVTKRHYWYMRVVHCFQRKADAAACEFYLTVLHLPQFNAIASFKGKNYDLNTLRKDDKKRSELLRKCRPKVPTDVKNGSATGRVHAHKVPRESTEVPTKVQTKVPTP